MQGLRSHTPIVSLLAKSLADDESFRLLDIGGTGVQADGWRDFGDRLRVLSVQNDEGPPPRAPGVLKRHGVAAEWTWRLPIKARFADNRMFYLAESDSPEPVETWIRQPVEASEPPAHAAPDLLEIVDASGFGDADFLKIDTGSQDFANLRALHGMLARATLLGVSVRAILSGPAKPEDNVLANTDALLRGHGFDLFTIDPVKYSSAVLPFPFMNQIQGACSNGRPLYARMVYLRPPEDLPAGRVLKAAALRAMIDLPDQAAEILATQVDRLPPDLDLNAAMQCLCVQVQENTGLAYPDHLAYAAAFEARDPLFYDFRARHGQWLAELIAYRRDTPARIAELEARLAELEQH